MPIHPTAQIDRGAEIDPAAEIGPFCIIEPHVRIAAGVRLRANVYVCRGTTVGANTVVHPNAVLGDAPQDVSYRDALSYTQIGESCLIRENVTIHRGTEAESTTVIGDRCFLMTGSHVAHNCQLGDDVRVASNAVFAGRVSVGRGTFIGGLAAVHQFCRIGEMVMLGGLSRVTMDIPPFMTFVGHGMIGPNTIGLRRAGLTSEERMEIRAAYRRLFRSGRPLRTALPEVIAAVKTAPGRRLIEFLQAPSKRGFHAASNRNSADDSERDGE
ncbi:MAG: acyl-ACP--UDP-N-acetylglucosamine O-acyltransferase [Phycisphaerae bacterium]|nr:acyl-ACP--UDP-N-acetylglucosamine O-acyltransferase [Phycisphaerae bacterium]